MFFTNLITLLAFAGAVIAKDTPDRACSPCSNTGTTRCGLQGYKKQVQECKYDMTKALGCWRGIEDCGVFNECEYFLTCEIRELNG
jgi:hypothetical protein